MLRTESHIPILADQLEIQQQRQLSQCDQSDNFSRNTGA